MSKGIPEGWGRSTLGKVARLTMGQSPSSDTYNIESAGLPFFQGNADFGSRYPRVRYWCNEPTKIANEQSILFSVRAPVGEVNIAPYKCCIGRGLAAIDGEKVHQEFLYQKLQYAKPQFQLLSQGSTFEAVNGSDLKEFDLVLPPLPEQQKIAAILSSVDNVIEKTRAQIDKLKDLKTGMMQELLTKGIGHTEFKDSPVGRIPDVWAVSAVSDVVRLASGGTPDRRRAEYWNGTIPWVKTGEVNYRTIHDTDEKITELGLSESSARLIPAGAILMAMYGQGVTRGKVAKLGVSAAVNQACLAMIPNDRILGDFLYYYFSHEYFSLRSMVQEGAQKNLSMSIVKEILLPVPPLREQEKIVNALQSIDKRIQIMRERLMGTIKIKKALMQDLLTGKVRVNVD